MKEEIIQYIAETYPNGDLDAMIRHLNRIGAKINNKSMLRSVASILGVKRSKEATKRLRSNSLLRLYQADRERIKQGKAPITKKIKPIRITSRQYNMRQILNIFGYVLTKKEMLTVGYNDSTARDMTLEQKCKKLGFVFYGCTDNS